MADTCFRFLTCLIECQLPPASSRAKAKDTEPQKEKVALKRAKTMTPAVSFDTKKEGLKDEQNTVQHYVFSWMNWAPEPDTPCYTALHQHFPGAMPGVALHCRTAAILGAEKYGFTGDNTLFGVSICPDEINQQIGELADLMKNHWGEVFPLGGISGAPFVGTTGFSAFSHHVPDDGNIVILFGPHVGITEEGDIGQYLREGQSHSSSACGAVIGAYNACCAGCGAASEVNDTDMQMDWIKAQLQPHIENVKGQSNPMAALAFQAYEMVRNKLEKIVDTKFGNGKLVLIGGIQINTPLPYQDHFLPMMYEVRQEGFPTEDLLNTLSCPFTQQEMEAAPTPKKTEAPKSVSVAKTVQRPSTSAFKGDTKQCELDHTAEAVEDAKHSKQHAVFSWLNFSPQPDSPCYRALHKQFPGALPGPGVHCRVKAILTADYDFTPDNTLYGNSICPDEINSAKGSLNFLMQDYWGELFPMGGIGGAPFVGKTGFKAFSHHVPDDGNIVVLYGPHIAISEKGEVGKYLRDGMHESSTACGAVIGAYHACCAKKGDEDEEFDELDMQMSWIKSQIQPHVERIKMQENPMAALSYQAFESVKTKINKVVNTDFGNGRLVLIGGIQINLPHPCSDHFLPIVFEVRQAGQPTENILEAFKCPLTQGDLHSAHEHFHFHHASPVPSRQTSAA